MALVDPQQQLYNTGNVELEDFAHRICAEARAKLKSPDQDGEDYFSRSFESEEQLRKTLEEIGGELIKRKFTGSLVLPPLILRSSEKFIAESDDLIFLAFENGAIVPVVKADKFERHVELIKFMYMQHANEWITSSNFTKYCNSEEE